MLTAVISDDLLPSSSITNTWPTSYAKQRTANNPHSPILGFNPPTVPFHLLSSTHHSTILMRSISTTPPKTPPTQPESPPQATSANTSTSTTLPHLTSSSEVHQISVSAKRITYRVALAIGHVRFSNAEPLHLIREHGLKKGDVLAVARVAGIQAVKKTAEVIPLAHGGVGVEGCVVRVEPVPGKAEGGGDGKESSAFDKDAVVEEAMSEEDRMSKAQLLSKPIGEHGGIRISVQVETTAKTGIEMEALTGVVGAALTVVDMCKGVDKRCVIDGVEVAGKKGGRSGGWGVWGNGKK